MTKYNFIKWIVVNTSDKDPFKHTDSNRTFWEERDAREVAKILTGRYTGNEFFTAVQVIVPYEPSPVTGLSDGPQGSYVPTNPVDPCKLERALETIKDAFPSIREAFEKPDKVRITNQQTKKEQVK